ncbi:MAG: flagellar M-ring protein FliF [Alphaproteobacteria bacterium]|nr:flagellar M-ring protein FliF [Alphaproteobacteria bacterium]
MMRIGPTRLIAGSVIVAIVAAGLFALLFRLGGEEKALLFSGIDMREAGEIVDRLEQNGIAYELRGDGTTIFVPRSQVLSARMMLSADGLPSRGSVGYEIFDSSDALGQTQFQQNINRLRALEGELSRTIESLDGVASARVHLVLPERQLFQRETQNPTASIVLELRRDDLTPGQVRAIRNLVAGAVPGLQSSRVTIVDGAGRMLAQASESGEEAIAEGVDARKVAIETRIRQTVMDIVEGVVGAGKARVQVNADMDFNRVTENSERFDPEGRVARSVRTSETTEESSDGSSGQAASASANIPDGAGGAGAASAARDSSTTSEEVTNYEISRTTRTEITEGGRMRRLSVAVAVDGVTTPGADGAEATWAPRDAAQLQEITALVRAAVGFNEERGDSVEVRTIQFEQPEAAQAAAAAKGGLPFEPMRLVEVGAMMLTALALIFFVLRPLIAGLVRGASGIRGATPDDVAIAGSSGGGGGGGMMAQLPGPNMDDLATPVDPVIDVARVQGQVRVSAVKKVAEVVAEHPEESAQIIRGWLNNAV